MEKDQNINNEDPKTEVKEPSSEKDSKEVEQDTGKKDEGIKEQTPEEKIEELEDKITRTFAEMENQRRRFEKEEKMLLVMVDLLLQKKL